MSTPTAPSPAASRSSLVADSRRSIAAEVGQPEAATLLRLPGNLGDDLLRAGTRRLLSTLPIGQLSEIGLADLDRARGELLLVIGGGAWCATYHELVPPLLPALRRRFERVIVLPSSYDPTVPAVRRALAESKGVVFFARESESFERIRGLCEARLALDGAHFFDFEPYRRPGSGTLLAYRTDAERSAGADLPEGNRDLAVDASDLDEFLWTIARAAEVRTDRAHVLIAGALLGKRVRFRPSNYFKVPAIAAFGLGEFDVLPDGAGDPPAVAATRGAGPSLPSPVELRTRLAAFAGPPPTVTARDAAGRPRVTVLMLISERASAPRAVRSLATSTLPLELLLVDHTTTTAVRSAVLAAAAEAGLAPTVVRPDHDLGTAAGRALGIARVATELVLLLDDDAEALPGTIERLVARLDAEAAAAVSPSVVLPDGRIQLCGGTLSIEDDFAVFGAWSDGLPFDDTAVGAAAPCGWAAGCGCLVRREVFERHPIDTAMAAYFEDNEWSYRVARTGDSGLFWREPRALVLHYLEPKQATGGRIADAVRLAPFLHSILHFHRRHGKILFNLFHLLPGLTRDGRPDLDAARLLIELGAARGADWILERWLAGGLEPLLAPPASHSEPDRTPDTPLSRREALALRAEFDRGQAKTLELVERHADLVARLSDSESRLAARGRRAEEQARQLEAERQSAARLSAELERERAQRAAASQLAEGLARDLAALRSTRWVRLADRYWRLRRRLR